jgi:phosphoglycolate phosphatase-like HAD superfamily hydrolase
MKLLLFDIDGTLIDPAGAGRRAAEHAFMELFSIPDAFSGIHMAGKTDIRIMKEGLRAHGLPSDPAIISRILDLYVDRLRLEILTPDKRLKPGVDQLLPALKRLQRVHLSLLTGNIEQGARIKLEPFGLNRFFSSGAFGSDHEDRDLLLPIALRKIRELTGVRIPPADCVVIGDTPADVRCAKVHEAFALAVATGPYTAERLLAAGADLVLEDLSGALDALEPCLEE